MSEQKTAELEAENQAGSETLETSSNLETKQPETQKDESPYAEQLERMRQREKELEDELKKKDELLEHKNRAIEASKKKIKEELSTEDELAEKLLKRLEEKQNVRKLDELVSALSSDQTEREVIKRHYQNSIVKTGDISADLKAAVALAESDKIWEQRSNRALEERREDYIASFAGTSLRGDTSSSMTRDPIRAQAEQFVRSVNPNAVKHLDNYFKK